MNSTPADDQKFAELLNENQNRILRICRVYAWNPADQEDLFQEIVIQIWRSMPALQEERFGNTWLYRVAINTAISFARKRGVRSGRIVYVEHSALIETIESQQTSPCDAEDRLANLYTSIYSLDPVERALVTLFLEGFTYEQIAETTGITANNVGVMLHRAKKKLSSLMKEETLR